MMAIGKCRQKPSKYDSKRGVKCVGSEYLGGAAWKVDTQSCHLWCLGKQKIPDATWKRMRQTSQGDEAFIEGTQTAD